jgi:hypothetical protein
MDRGKNTTSARFAAAANIILHSHIVQSNAYICTACPWHFSEYYAVGTLYPLFFSGAWYSTLKLPERGIRLWEIPLEFSARYCTHKLKMAEAIGLHQWFSFFLCLFACEKDVFLFRIIYQLHTCNSRYSRKFFLIFFSNTPRSKYVTDKYSSFVYMGTGVARLGEISLSP